MCWMQLEQTMWCEASQKEKDEHRTVSLAGGTYEVRQGTHFDSMAPVLQMTCTFVKCSIVFVKSRDDIHALEEGKKEKERSKLCLGLVKTIVAIFGRWGWRHRTHGGVLWNYTHCNLTILQSPINHKLSIMKWKRRRRKHRAKSELGGGY